MSWLWRAESPRCRSETGLSPSSPADQGSVSSHQSPGTPTLCCFLSVRCWCFAFLGAAALASQEGRKEVLATGLKIIHPISSCFSSAAQQERLVYQDIKQECAGEGDSRSLLIWEPLRRVLVYKCIRLWLSSLWT